jgi:hypothetical protein
MCSITPKGERTARIVASVVSMCSGFPWLVGVCGDVKRVCRWGRWTGMSSLSRGLMSEVLQNVVNLLVIEVMIERWMAWRDWVFC